MKLPMVFEPYEPARADAMFPMISEHSTYQDVMSYAWMHALDLMGNDPMILADAIVGEYLDTLDDMRHYHGEVLQALADEDYKRMGKLVEEAVGCVTRRVADYIEEHIEYLKGE
jgi:hypothetical protein